jgi:hypothetical protein
VKTGKARTIPIHPHLVEMGLLDYVEAVKARSGKQGPLFFRPPARSSRNPSSDLLISYRAPAVKARERLAARVRDLGITDPSIQPNHACRHTFKRRQPVRASSRGYGMASADMPPGQWPWLGDCEYASACGEPSSGANSCGLKNFPMSVRRTYPGALSRQCRVQSPFLTAHLVDGEEVSVLATRKPTRMLRKSVKSLLRRAARRSAGKLYQEPPRLTRNPQSPDVHAEPSEGAPT